MSTTTPEYETSPRDLGAPLDALLVDAAAGSLHRFLPGAESVAFGASLAVRPIAVTGEALSLAQELGRVVLGTSTHEPSTRDRRFADPAWHDNPFLHRSVQAHLAGARASIASSTSLSSTNATTCGCASWRTTSSTPRRRRTCPG